MPTSANIVAPQISTAFEMWTGLIGAPPTAASGTDAYSASKSEWVALAKVFADLDTWWGQPRLWARVPASPIRSRPA